MKNLWTGLLVLALSVMFVGDAMGAATAAQRSGQWNATSTWDTGAVPTAADAVTIAGGFTVRANAISVATTTLTVGGTGTGELIFEGAITADVNTFIVKANGKIRVRDGCVLSGDETPTGNGWFDVDTATTVGHQLIFEPGSVITMDSADVTGASDVLIRSVQGSSVSILGQPLGNAEVKDVGTGTTPPALDVEFTRKFSDATHVRVLNGPFFGAIHQISSWQAGNTARLKRGLLQDTTSVSAAAVDSVRFLDTDADEVEGPGAITLVRSAAGEIWTSLGFAAATFTHNSGTTVMVEKPLPERIDTSWDVMLVEHFEPGTKVQFFKAAIVRGQDTVPNADNDSQIITIHGEHDIGYAAFENLGAGGANSFAVFVDDGPQVWSGPTIFEDCWNQSTLSFDDEASGTIGARHRLVENIYFTGITETPDADSAHLILLNDDDEEDVFELNNIACRDALDDLVFADDGWALYGSNWWYEHGIYSQIIDTRDWEGPIEVDKIWAWGLGETPLMMDNETGTSAQIKAVFTDVNTRSCGNAYNRGGAGNVGSHNTTTINSRGFLLVAATFTGSVVIDGGSCRWTPYIAVDLVPTVATGDVVIRGVEFKYNTHFQDPDGNGSGTNGNVYDSTYMGSSIVVDDGTLSGRTLIEDCVFEDNPRRGIVSATLNALASRGITFRGGTAGLRNVVVNRCTFNTTQLARDEFTRTSGAYAQHYIVNSGDVAALSYAIQRSKFTNGVGHIKLVPGAQTTNHATVSGNVFVMDSGSEATIDGHVFYWDATDGSPESTFLFAHNSMIDMTTLNGIMPIRFVRAGSNGTIRGNVLARTNTHPSGQGGLFATLDVATVSAQLLFVDNILLATDSILELNSAEVTWASATPIEVAGSNLILEESGSAYGVLFESLETLALSPTSLARKWTSTGLDAGAIPFE